MRSGFVIIVGLLPLVGCSTLLDYEDVSFEEPGSQGGSGGATQDASVEAGGQDGSSGTGGTAGAGGTSGSDAKAEGGSGGSEADAEHEPLPDPCDGVGCSGHGSCVIADGGQPTCACDTGYHAEGLQCVQDETCDGVDCGRCGHCDVVEGVATCTCPTGFTHDGSRCVTDPDPCDGVDCGPDGVCVPEAHCTPLGACVPTCDCSNCGNCGPDNSDGRWNDWQEYCGAEPDQSPATMECNKPCPPGDGCLPFAQPLCWPMEGCFSL